MHFSVFEFVLSSTQAFNQVGMFFGAMACLGLGGLILVNSLYWRVHAVRALGTIIGVTTKKNLYFPVYRTHCQVGRPAKRGAIAAPT